MTNGRAAEPAPLLYVLRPATADDVQFIHGLRVSGLRQHVARHWGWDEAEQRAMFQRQYDPSSYQVIVVDGREVGAMSVHWTNDEALLADLEIAPEWRNRGLGTALLRDLLAEAARRALPVTLQVLKGNHARSLYVRLGFQIVGDTATHIVMRAWRDSRVPGVDSDPTR